MSDLGPILMVCKVYVIDDLFWIYKIGNKYFESNNRGQTLNSTDDASAKASIGRTYVTKSYSYNGDVTTVTLSDGREFVHPRSALDSPDETMVYVSEENSFISLKELDEIIENIPLEVR